MMTRNRIVVSILIVIILVAFGAIVVLVGNQRRSSSNLSWNVEVGESFIYEVECFYWDSSSNDSVFAQLALLNHTHIRMEIVSLPQIPSEIDRSIFSTEVINHTKAHCSFENNSELPVNYYDDINQLLSSSILPVGDWYLLDWCFADETSEAFYPGTYISKLQMNHFTIGYELWAGDALLEWSANVTLEDGIPQAAFIDRDFISVGLHYIIQLVLLS